MNTEINDGGPAFPSYLQGTFGTIAVKGEGMTLRDYFASKVMSKSFKRAFHPAEKEGAAIRCYAIADAMIAERSKHGQAT